MRGVEIRARARMVAASAARTWTQGRECEYESPRKRTLRARHAESRGAIAQERGTYHAASPRGHRFCSARVLGWRLRPIGALCGRGGRARTRHANGHFEPTAKIPGEIMRRNGDHTIPRAMVVTACAARACIDRDSGQLVPYVGERGRVGATQTSAARPPRGFRGSYSVEAGTMQCNRLPCPRIPPSLRS